MNNGDENHTELLTVQETRQALEGAGFLGVRAHQKTLDRSPAGISPWEVLAFPCRRSNGLGAAPAERSRSGLTCGLH